MTSLLTAEEWDEEAGLAFPGLYVGSMRAVNAEHLHGHDIGGVLTAAGRLNMSVPDGVKHKTLSGLQDHPCANLLGVLEEAMQFMDTIFVDGRNKAVLVHCASGISRSVGICIGWLMCRRGFSYKDALAKCRLARPHAMPNAGFQQQLLSLDKCNCNLPESVVHYNDSLKGSTVTALLIEMRDHANALHGTVDLLEEEIKATGQPSGPVQKEWARKLEALQNKLDDFANANPHIEDRVSSMVRKAASRKCVLLMGDLEKFNPL